jgi:reductive dehalogenase
MSRNARAKYLPTYQKDVVGAIQRWDERDILFARHDLFRYFGVGSPEYQAYYQAHPEHLEYDTKIAALPGLGRTGGVDAAMFDAQFAAIKQIGGESFVNGEPVASKSEISPERAAQKVKALARLLGADLVKIGPLRQEWVYSHVGRSIGNQEGYQRWGTPTDLSQHSNAIALGLAMNLDLLRSAPDFPILLATARGYATGAWVAIQLAQYIRLLGYSARAHHLNNYQVLCVPVAVDCGLGELSRAGYLLTKEFGLGLRLAVVTTDMPLAHDAPIDIGVQSYCNSCRICAEACPIGAIPLGDKVEFNGMRKWKLDEEKCYRYWQAAGTDCGLCMVFCPWTKPRNWFHKTMAELAAVPGPHQSLMTQAHKLIYGKFQGAPRPGFIDPYGP